MASTPPALPAQPTTPLRPPSRSSLRSSHGHGHGHARAASAAEQRLALANVAAATLEPALAELSDGMADLEANFMHLQIMHESLARFTECFASFLYGLNINAFCVDFPEAPVADSFRRAMENPAFTQPDSNLDADQTFMTSETSFVENPPASVAKSAPAPAPPRGRGASAAAASGARGSRAGSTRGAAAGRGAAASGRGGTAASSGRGRASGLPRGPSSRSRAGTYR